MNIEISKKMVRRIISIMADYFDADNVTMSTSTDGHISVEMSSNEAVQRVARLDIVENGPIIISVDYSIPDSTMKIRLFELELFIGGIVSRFSPLTVDIHYPDELVTGIKEILKGGEN